MSSIKSETQGLSRPDMLKLMAAGVILLIALVVFYVFAEYSLLARMLGLLAASGGAAAIAFQTAPGLDVLEFIKGARTEVRKVVWPTRTETIQTTLAVIAMVIVMGVLLWLLDLLLLWLVRLVTG